MTFLKRISTSIFARVDQIVGEIENHEALIRVAIDEQRKKLASAKLQYARIRSFEKQANERIAENSITARKWEQRAIREAGSDESRALLCLQKKQQVEKLAPRLKEVASEYREAAARIEKDITRCEDELKKVSQKHEIMRARQSSADAISVIVEGSPNNLDEMQSSFDRWEVNLAKAELLQDPAEVDLLEQDYIAEEQEEALKSELKELMNINGQRDG